MADVLELAALHFACSQRQAWRGAFEGLHTRHLVSADDTFTGSPARRCFPIDGAHVGDLLIALLGRFVGGGCEPIPNQVRLEIGFC